MAVPQGKRNPSGRPKACLRQAGRPYTGGRNPRGRLPAVGRPALDLKEKTEARETQEHSQEWLCHKVRKTREGGNWKFDGMYWVCCFLRCGGIGLRRERGFRGDP
jgi:hypothetical protein